jgi:fatty acid desaturase
MQTALFTELNWLAIAVAAIAFFGLGAIWYSVLFGKRWVAYQGIQVDENAKSGMAQIMLASFVLMFIAVISLALLVRMIGLNGWLPGVKIGLLTGVGFALTSISVSYLYVKKPLGLHLIDGLYHVVGNVIAGIILCVWQ